MKEDKPLPLGLIAVLGGALAGIASAVWVVLASVAFLIRSCL